MELSSISRNVLFSHGLYEELYGLLLCDYRMYAKCYVFGVIADADSTFCVGVMLFLMLYECNNKQTNSNDR